MTGNLHMVIVIFFSLQGIFLIMYIKNLMQRTRINVLLRLNLLLGLSCMKMLIQKRGLRAMEKDKQKE